MKLVFYLTESARSILSITGRPQRPKRAKKREKIGPKGGSKTQNRLL